MFALRCAAAFSARSIAARTSVRSFSVFGARLSGAVSKDTVETNIGPGAAPGEVPTDLQQATGLERQELLAKLKGKELFDMEPLNMTHLGTKENPIVVKSYDNIRFVGCTGYPAESHDTIWLTLDRSHEFDRCPECGSVYKMDFVGSDDDNGHH
ncbi:hypothetical protein VTP01DRAFT_1271 [Rhizomucor pusillus]|uniref:uncharacterized protein n=1 Tax=Rhizomucor pusillus TaxID=4840 RepID=UPI003743E8C9